MEIKIKNLGMNGEGVGEIDGKIVEEVQNVG